MDKRILIVLLVIIIAGAAVFGLTRNKKDNTQTNSSQNSSANSGTQAQSANTTPPQTKTPTATTSSVSIESFAFMPGDITVKKGTTVTWTNNDSTAHTVTEADSQTGPKSDNLNNGDKYTFTFDTAGTFHYKCSIHPYMLGTVTVTE
jgi:plastocyanin